MAMMGPETSLMARWAASRGASPASMLRSTFSTTTMASSTTMPMASTSPNSVSVLIEKPSISSTAKVPTIDTGTASSGITEARQVCRNSTTTITTSSTASSSVATTARIDCRTNTVGSYSTLHSRPGGKSVEMRFMVARTSLESWIVLAPGASKIGIATARWLSLRERSEYSAAPSSTRAMSRTRVSSPVGPALTMMSANSSTVDSRPCALIETWKSAGRPWGGAPMEPADTWTFCSRMARSTSPAAMPRAAARSGSSQTRIA